jgi:hypothetical protein
MAVVLNGNVCLICQDEILSNEQQRCLPCAQELTIRNYVSPSVVLNRSVHVCTVLKPCGFTSRGDVYAVASHVGVDQILNEISDVSFRIVFDKLSFLNHAYSLHSPTMCPPVP